MAREVNFSTSRTHGAGVREMPDRTANNDPSNAGQPPLRPTALLNFKKTDDELAKIVARFWQMIWANGSPAIPQRMKCLLSLANAVGASRLRQATRELVKAYAAGTTIAEFDELFCLFVWNQGGGVCLRDRPFFAVRRLPDGQGHGTTGRQSRQDRAGVEGTFRRGESRRWNVVPATRMRRTG